MRDARRAAAVVFGALGIFGLVLVACVAPPPPTPTVVAASSTPSNPTTKDATASPTPTPAASPTRVEQPLPSGLDPAVASAIDQRRMWGLRSDLEYVLGTWTDPRATISFMDFPMYPEEEEQMYADLADQNAAVAAINTYAAAHADEFGGVYIDRDQHPGVVTSLWTDHLEAHLAAISASLEGKVTLVRQVRDSYAALDALQQPILEDLDWMAAIPARMQSLGVDILDNVIDLEVSSAEPTAVQQIAAHYGLGDRLRITSDGTGEVLIPSGTVKGKVLLPNGKRLGQNELSISYEYEVDNPGQCGGGDIGYGISDDGTFEYPCQAGVRTLIVTGDGNKELGRAAVRVLPGATSRVTIRLTRNP